MFSLFVFFFFLSLAVGLGLFIHHDPGYVLVIYDKWSIEAPLWLTAVALILGFYFIYSFLSILNALMSAQNHLFKWRDKRRQQYAQRFTDEGFIALAEGHWLKAEKGLVKGALHGKNPFLNYLSAARAAEELGAHQRRDKYLTLAHETTSGTDIAVALTQAQLQLSHGQYEQSLATLKHLRQTAPAHPFVLKLLQKLYVNLKDWDQLGKLLPALNKAKVLSSEEQTTLAKQVYSALLAKVVKDSNKNRLHDLWEEVPSDLRLNAELIYIYVKALHSFKEEETAEIMIRQALKREWSEDLVVLYGFILSSNLARQLSTAESWLKRYPKSSGLLLTLGRLCQSNQLWGKAKDYFEASLSQKTTPEACCELARLLEYLNKTSESAALYKKGLMLVTECSVFPK